MPGERGTTLTARTRSLHARLNALLAGALSVAVLAAMLAWYYGHVLRGGAPAGAPRGALQHPDPLGVPPPLGDIPPPSPGRSSAAKPACLPRCTRVNFSSLTAVAAEDLGRWRVPRERPAPTPARMPSAAPSNRVLHRQLSGAVFIAAHSPGHVGAREGVIPAVPRAASRRGAADSSSAGLRALLRPAVLRATRARLLPQRRLLLAKGTFIDCTLETAIDSTLPGMTTCITATDTFSADGTVVLLPRGTQLIGQTRGAVRRGMARVFVIWTQARTPSGVVVRLDSPATDSLGRSGLSGTVERHFWERFGAALLVSTLSGAVQSRMADSGGAVIVEPAGGEAVLAQTLRGSEDIPPTIRVASGRRIEVLVARDVDFRSVYALVPR